MIDSERSFAMKEVAPLPWQSYETRTPPHLYRLVDAQDLTVLLVPGKPGTGTGDRAKEIAEYVRRAVNSHEELLTLAKAVLEHKQRRGYIGAGFEDLVWLASEAINKAERGES